MANLIAGRRLVPELIQHEFTADAIVRELKPLLADSTARSEMMEGLREVRHRLRSHAANGQPGRAIERSAEIIMDLLQARGGFGSSNSGASSLPAGTYQG
jgi:lipid-A-disaccharide synthase